MLRGKYRGKRVGRLASMRGPVCGSMIDMRDLGKFSSTRAIAASGTTSRAMRAGPPFWSSKSGVSIRPLASLPSAVPGAKSGASPRFIERTLATLRSKVRAGAKFVH